MWVAHLKSIFKVIYIFHSSFSLGTNGNTHCKKSYVVFSLISMLPKCLASNWHNFRLDSWHILNSNCTNFYYSNDSLGLLLQNMNNKMFSINLKYFLHSDIFFTLWALYKFLLANVFYCHPIFALQSNNFRQQCDPRTHLVVTYFISFLSSSFWFFSVTCM